MSVAQLKDEVSRLPLEDRIEIADFLAEQDASDEAARRARIAWRMRRMDGGRKITIEHLAAMHQAMVNIGL